MKQSAEIGKLAAALVAVQAEVRGVAKDSTNPDYRSSYTSLDAIIEKIRPVLVRHQLAVVQGATTPHSDDTGRIAAIAVETMLIHASGEWLTNTAIMPVVGRMLKGGGRGDVDPQAGGSALTYGRRYGLAALLCLSTEEDDDGNAASKQGSGAKKEGRAGNTGKAAGTPPTATAQPAPPAPVLTRDTPVPFAPAFKDGTQPAVGELPYKFLQFVLDAPEKRIPAPHRDAWTAFFRKELEGREAGEFTMLVPAGATP